jgi:hypothetical protein
MGGACTIAADMDMERVLCWRLAFIFGPPLTDSDPEYRRCDCGDGGAEG